MCRYLVMLVMMGALTLPMAAQSILHRADSILSEYYFRDDGIDTSYVVRPQEKWTLSAKMNVSGTTLESEGIDQGKHFKSKLHADNKATVSIGVNYLGLGLSLAVNPAKLSGKYSDLEIGFRSYGRRFGFDVVYQDAKNFKGWHDHEGMPRIYLSDDIIHVKTLNVNAFYVFNSKKFSYPAAFSQSYIQRRSAGGFMLALSGQGQRANLEGKNQMNLKMFNIGIGAGYGYNFVPGRGWLLHISSLPTFIVYSKTSLSFDAEKIPLNYHFPEVIITGRGAVVKQWKRTYLGTSMLFNFTNVGYKKHLEIHNIKWDIQAFFGIRLGKK